MIQITCSYFPMRTFVYINSANEGQWWLNTWQASVEYTMFHWKANIKNQSHALINCAVLEEVVGCVICIKKSLDVSLGQIYELHLSFIHHSHCLYSQERGMFDSVATLNYSQSYL